jgi:hypothetical protein
MSDTPKFASTPRISKGRTTGALTSTQRLVTTVLPTNAVEVIQGGTNGTLVDRIKMVNLDPVGTAITDAAQVYRFFLFDGTNYYLFHEVNSGTIAAPTVTAAGYQQVEFFNPPIVLPGVAWKIFAGITKRTDAGSDTDFIAFAADL